ncbi:hypothetical protein JI667_09955 [Bacillus sp. NTK074B]|uniref:BsuPI-related putative proteinase inhibitor n=1 Tax=Bacillus sp. NTK074B TaxID=2802174 RepID=UPI001A8C3311|nr:hypothetical protein [Bacillus sp. NTK074B]
MKAILYILICSILFMSSSLTVGAGRVPLIFSVDALPGEEGVEIQLLLYNNSERDMNITFPTSQMFEFTIKNEKGKVVYRYSEGKSFLQALQTTELKRRGTKILKESWDYVHGGNRAPAGDYTIEAVLMGEDMNGFNHPLRATASFQIPEENPSFRNVKIREIKGVYTVSGQARVSNGSFYYSVEDGHRVLIPETFQKVNKEAPNWSDFTIILNQVKGKNDNLIVSLYERDAGDGKIVHPFVIAIP